jgi:hypothetical protein
MDYEVDGGRVLFRRTESERAPLLRRVALIEGQLRGTRTMIEHDRYCPETLQSSRGGRSLTDVDLGGAASAGTFEAAAGKTLKPSFRIFAELSMLFSNEEISFGWNRNVDQQIDSPSRRVTASHNASRWTQLLCRLSAATPTTHSQPDRSICAHHRHRSFKTKTLSYKGKDLS